MIALQDTTFHIFYTIYEKPFTIYSNCIVLSLYLQNICSVKCVYLLSYSTFPSRHLGKGRLRHIHSQKALNPEYRYTDITDSHPTMALTTARFSDPVFLHMPDFSVCQIYFSSRLFLRHSNPSNPFQFSRSFFAE